MREYRELHDICELKFGVLSAREIERQSAVKVTGYKITNDEGVTGGLYDPRMGSVKNGVVCETCNRDGSECVGHFGHVELSRPVVHPLFTAHVVNLLKLFCSACSGLLVQLPADQKGKQRFVAACEQVKKCAVTQCPACGSAQPDYRTAVVDNCSVVQGATVEECLRVLDNVSDATVTALGLDPEMVHPRNFIIRNFPVIPTCCRPFVTSDGSVCDDDLTYQLSEIVKNNTLYEQTRDEKFYCNLLFRIHTYFNNSQNKAKHATTGRAIMGISQRIAGKGGRIRNNLLGKRTNQSGRTVIGPDTYVDMDTVVVPRMMADILTVTEYVNGVNEAVMNADLEAGRINYVIRDGKKINVAVVTEASRTGIYRHGDELLLPGGTHVVTDTRRVPGGALAVFRDGAQVTVQRPERLKLRVGDTVYRKLRDGDTVLLNRQPTLHKASMLAFKAKIVDGVKTLKINLAVSSPFNCDFDGDEMNIHVPQNYEAVSEMRELSTVKQCLISSQAGKPNIAVVQDALTAAYLLTKYGDEPVGRCDFLRIVSRLDRIPGPGPYTRRDVVNFVLPSGLSVRYDDLVIERGKIVSGYLCKKYLGSTHSSLIKTINALHGADECCRFVNELQVVCNEWLAVHGFSITAADCSRTCDVRDDILDKCFMEAESHRLSIRHPKIRERKIIYSLSKAKDVGMRLAKESLHPDNNFITTVESGSKGDYFNIAQITGLLGQQTVINGQRIVGSLPYYRRARTVRQSYESMGFISGSFERGLDPCEFFFHAMSGRKGVCDTAMSTATSGYNMRRVVKLTEDIVIHYDGTVRDNKGKMYQMAYNGCGYDPTKTYRGSVCDVAHSLS